MLRNDRYNVLNGVAGAVALNMIHPYIGILAVRLGADDLQLGYLSSWPAAVSVLAVLGAAVAIARSAQKQRVIAALFLFSRIAALAVASVPFLPEGTRVWALIGFWVLWSFPNFAANTALQAFLADVFPGTVRGRALSSRQAWATGAGMVVAFSTGWALDHFFAFPSGYQIVFAASFAVGLVEIFFFLRLREVVADDGSPTPQSQALGLRSYLAVFHNRPYTRFLVCSVLFHFAWQTSWPMFTRFQVTELGADNTWLSIFNLAGSTVSIISYPIWARMAERYGNARILPVAALWLSTAPVLSSLIPNVQWMAVLNLFTGVGVAGVMLMVLNSLLDVSPARNRPVYLAVHAAAVSISAAIAPIVGAYAMGLGPIRLTLGLSSIPRFLAALIFVWLFLTGRSRQGMADATSNQAELETV